MEARKEEQRGVVRFLVAEGARTHAIKLNCSGILSDGIILLHDKVRSHTANLVRDKLKRFGWETPHHPMYNPDLSLVISHFLRPEERHSWTSVSFGR